MLEILTTSRNVNVPADYWRAVLSDGTIVYDDNMWHEKRAWVRLAEHLEENNLSIVDFSAEIGGCLVQLPPNQPGYVQFKKAMSTGSWSTTALCVGFVQGSLCKLFTVSPDKNSTSVIMDDPGKPKTIYGVSNAVT